MLEGGRRRESEAVAPLLARLQQEYEYEGIETCAVDGSCAIPCPVEINTGALVKTFRRAESTPARERFGRQCRGASKGPHSQILFGGGVLDRAAAFLKGDHETAA